MAARNSFQSTPEERTHLAVWKDVWSVYCECFRDNFGDHPVELSPIALEAFAVRIQEAVRQDLSEKTHMPIFVDGGFKNEDTQDTNAAPQDAVSASAALPGHARTVAPNPAVAAPDGHFDKQEKERIPWDIDLDLTLLDPLLIRCGACLRKYSLSPRDDQEHLTHLYECPHCHQPLDSRAWLYAVRNLQKLLRQVPSARGDGQDTARLDYMERFIVEGTNLESGKVAWLADVECLRETIDEAIVQERIKTPYVGEKK